MDKNYKTQEDGTVTVDGSSSSSSSTAKSNHPYNYVEQWNNVFMCPNFLEKSKASALKGDLRNFPFRSLCWKLHLDCLPEDQSKWIQHTRKQRQAYAHLIANFANNPRGSANNQNCDLSVNNPLSQEKSSEWNQYFEDGELRVTIKQDVDRTFPEIEFFQEQWVKELMIEILFSYAKQFPKISYKQGMHELLAPVLFVFYSDQQSFMHASQSDILQMFYSFTREMIGELMDPSYLEHDSYTMFCQLMDSVEQWYLIRDIYPAKKSVCNSQPFARSEHLDLSNIIILKLKRIVELILKKHDPQLYSHLDKMEIAPQIYGIRWLRLLFGREFQLHDLLVIWDALFADGPSLGLVDYIFVSMLMYIRTLLLTSDYATCLTFLMRYPAVADVSYIIDHSLFLRDPIRYVKPAGYSSEMMKHVPTVRGVPNIHRALPANRHRPAVPQSSPKKKSNSMNRPTNLAFADFVEIDKDGHECNSNESSRTPGANVELPTVSKTKRIMGKHVDATDSNKPMDGGNGNGSGSSNRPVALPRSQRRASIKQSQQKLQQIEEEVSYLKEMHTHCANVITQSINQLQDSILDNKLDNQHDMLLSLASLKQVRDMLHGTLPFSKKLFEEAVEAGENLDKLQLSNQTTHKSSLTVKLHHNQSVCSNNSEASIEALLCSNDIVEPQVASIQFNQSEFQ